MELCTSTTVQSLSNLPPTLHRHHNNLLTSNPNTTNLRLKPSLPLRLHSRLLSVRATSSEESGSNLYGGEEPDGGAVSTYELPPPEKKTYSQAVIEEAPKEESTVNGIDGQTQISEFLENFDIKLDNDGAYVYLLYGGGALVTLWLVSAVVGAIDSIPLFPKLMEVVGLGYTIWFSTRYLIFKKDRDELVAKVQVLKKQVLGSSDD